jgi:hypothetical protein
MDDIEAARQWKYRALKAEAQIADAENRDQTINKDIEPSWLPFR